MEEGRGGMSKGGKRIKISTEEKNAHTTETRGGKREGQRTWQGYT